MINIQNKLAVITGAGGLLGQQHAEIIAFFGGIPILLDKNISSVKLLAKRIYSKYGSSGWNCQEKLPKKDHLLAGNKYINKICEKTFEKKKIVLHSEFYFINNKEDKSNLISRTKMKIEKYPSS